MFVTLAMVDMLYCMLFLFYLIFCWAARALGALPTYAR